MKPSKETDLNDIIRKKLIKLALKIEAEAKKKCPVDTGRLRASLSHNIEGNKVVVGSNVDYAPYVEYGTEKMKAQPFLRPALDIVKNQSK